MDIRAFISVGIPASPGLSALENDLMKIRGIRTVLSKNIHLTLKFIGDIDPSAIGKLRSCVENAASETRTFSIQVKGLGKFPEQGDPRILWAGAESGGVLENLSERIGLELDSIGMDHDRKRFRPHVTVGRISGHTDLNGILRKYDDFEFSDSECDRIMIMESILHKSGAEHRMMDEIHLMRR